MRSRRMVCVFALERESILEAPSGEYLAEDAKKFCFINITNVARWMREG